MLMTENLVLLLTDDRSGKLSTGSADLTLPLGGAVLLELMRQNRVGLDPAEDVLPALLVTSAEPTGDEALDRGLTLLAEHPDVAADSALYSLGVDALQATHRALVEKGVLHETDDHVLGIFPRHRWPAETTAYESDLRTSVVALLREQQPTDTDVWATTALLSAASCLTFAIDHHDVDLGRNALVERGVEVSGLGWAPEPLRVAVEQIRAGIHRNQVTISTSAVGEL